MTGELALVVDEWFDGERRHRDGPTTLRVERGRIADVAPGDHGAELSRIGIEVRRGAFLMPGLVDAHVHLFLDGAPTDAKARSAHLKKPVEELAQTARASARQAFACGVTLVRDAGDRHGINHRVRAEAARPGSAMSRVRSSGRGLKRAQRYGAFMGTDVSGEESICAAVAQLARDSDEIKLILTGIIDFDAGAVTDEPQFSLEEARCVTRAAGGHGLATFAHCSGERGLEIASRSGVGSIEHGFFMTRDVLRRMAENGIAWTPTFCPVHFQWARPEAAGWSKGTVGNLRRILDGHAQHLALAHAMGVPLLLGTDAGSMGVEHGHALADEIARYLEAGLPLQSVLRAATSTARRHFGLPDPVLRRGAAFDAVLLQASPFEDARALRQVAGVWA